MDGLRLLAEHRLAPATPERPILIPSHQKDKLYRKYKSGDTRALYDLLEAERVVLYDYALRMTGQVSRSIDAIDDAYQGLTDEILDNTPSVLELRVAVYTMVRKFNADIWNADTQKLTNAVLDVPSEAKLDPKDKAKRLAADKLARQHAAYKALDRSLRARPGAEREAVILRTRCRFEFRDVAAVMGLDEERAEALFLSGMTKIDAECSGIVEGPEDALMRMPGHLAPERSSQATINLSEVMQGIKARPVGLWSPTRFVLLVAVGMLIGAWLFYPESLRDASRALKALVSGRGS